MILVKRQRSDTTCSVLAVIVLPSAPTLSGHFWLTLLCLLQNSETALVLYNIHIPFCTPAHLFAEEVPNLHAPPRPQGRDHHSPAQPLAPDLLLAPAALQKLLWRWRSLRSPHTSQLRGELRGFAVGRLRVSMEGAAGRGRLTKQILGHNDCAFGRLGFVGGRQAEPRA